MSRFFTQAAYAEDQQNAMVILGSHVLHRGFQAGAGLGLVSAASVSLASLLRKNSQGFVIGLSKRAIPYAGFGGAVGVLGLTFGLVQRMKGREKIEWQDRSWRLLANPGQVEVDDWSVAGALIGLVTFLRRPSWLTRTPANMMAPVRLVGGIGIGSIGGVVGYMIWRHGINRGRFPEVKIKPDIKEAVENITPSQR